MAGRERILTDKKNPSLSTGVPKDSPFSQIQMPAIVWRVQPVYIMAETLFLVNTMIQVSHGIAVAESCIAITCESFPLVTGNARSFIGCESRNAGHVTGVVMVTAGDGQNESVHYFTL